MVYWLALQDKRHILPQKVLEYLLRKYDSLEIIWNLKYEDFLKNKIPKKNINSFLKYRSIVNLNLYYEELLKIKNKNVNIIKYNDKDYPKKLKNSAIEIYNPPLILFVKGTIPNLDKCAAIVGTRKASFYGRQMARLISESLAKKGYVITSGLARGIDLEAHYGALSYPEAKTISILAWLDPIYPPEHEAIAKDIIKRGAIISEKYYNKNSLISKYTSTNLKYTFIERNRIISGLADFLVAVESGVEGGTQRQVDLAIEQNKRVFVVKPESNDSKDIIEGYNLMIKKGAIPIDAINAIPLKNKNYFEKEQKIKLDAFINQK